MGCNCLFEGKAVRAPRLRHPTARAWVSRALGSCSPCSWCMVPGALFSLQRRWSGRSRQLGVNLALPAPILPWPWPPHAAFKPSAISVAFTQRCPASHQKHQCCFHPALPCLAPKTPAPPRPQRGRVCQHRRRRPSPRRARTRIKGPASRRSRAPGGRSRGDDV